MTAHGGLDVAANERLAGLAEHLGWKLFNGVLRRAEGFVAALQVQYPGTGSPLPIYHFPPSRHFTYLDAQKGTGDTDEKHDRAGKRSVPLPSNKPRSNLPQMAALA